MSRSTLTAGSQSYVISPDDPIPTESRLRAFIAGQALDDVTHQPLPSTLRVTADEPGFVIQVKDDNWFVIAGLVRTQIPLLSTAAAHVHLHLSAPGYQAKALTATIPLTPSGTMPALVVLPSVATEMQRQP